MTATTRFQLVVLASSSLPEEGLARPARIEAKTLHMSLRPRFPVLAGLTSWRLSPHSTPSIRSTRVLLIATHPASNHTFPKRPAASSN